MKTNFIGAVLAFCIGVCLASAGYVFARHVLKTQPSRFVAVQVGKQFLQIVFLVLLYVLGGYTPWDRIWLLVGGCLGITLPMGWFTYRLVKLNDSLKGKEDASDE